MSKGKINVAVENIFPLIKKFLYSDHEIFLRELISNATDATTKLSHLSSLGEVKGDLGDLTIEVKVDKKGKKLHLIDKGIGMTQEEVQKYINEVAFSGAEEFLEQYQIIQAYNGEEGIELALEHIPDLIISDVMMPKVSGLEAIRQIKAKETDD